MTCDAIVIGGGINGLACATALAKSGLRSVLLEQRDTVGGCAVNGEIAPGFTVPLLAHAAGPLRRDVAEVLELHSHGLRAHDAGIDVSALSPDGRGLTLYTDAARTAQGLRGWSSADAARWPAFQSSLQRMGGLIGSLFLTTPPSIDAPTARDLFSLMHTLGDFRAMPTDDQWRLLRWGPMAVADLVAESVDTELLRATLAADGIFAAMLGPWSAGSGLQLLLSWANRSLAWPGGRTIAGGPAAITRALAAAAARFGVEIKTGCEVTRILIDDDRARGVELAGGAQIKARTVVSGLDPKRTFLALCDADYLPPEFRWRITHVRTRGTLAKINLALSSLPTFAGATHDMLAGRVRLAPDLDYLERAFDHAKYGRFSPHPWIEFTIPSLLDPSLAPNGSHVLSAYAQFAPYDLRDGSWDTQRDALRDAVIRTLSAYAPDLPGLVVAAQAFTPLDLEREWGLTGGHVFHGELALDQCFTMRPLLGSAQYHSPVTGLFLCGSGTHPGTGLTGGSGLNAAREIQRRLR